VLRHKDFSGGAVTAPAPVKISLACYDKGKELQRFSKKAFHTSPEVAPLKDPSAPTINYRN